MSYLLSDCLTLDPVKASLASKHRVPSLQSSEMPYFCLSPAAPSHAKDRKNQNNPPTIHGSDHLNPMS